MSDRMEYDNLLEDGYWKDGKIQQLEIKIIGYITEISILNKQVTTLRNALVAANVPMRLVDEMCREIREKEYKE